MQDGENEKLKQLNDALQVAAINLINHLQTRHVRIRIRDTTPELYITLSEGRHANAGDDTTGRAQQEAYVAAAQDSSPFSFFAKLRKA